MGFGRWCGSGCRRADPQKSPEIVVRRQGVHDGQNDDKPKGNRHDDLAIGSDTTIGHGMNTLVDHAGHTVTYALGHSDQELDRLAVQARLIDPITRRFFRDAGIVSGMRVLDVGSGSGDTAFLAANLVGDTGQVVGRPRSSRSGGGEATSGRSVAPQRIIPRGRSRRHNLRAALRCCCWPLRPRISARSNHDAAKAPGAPAAWRRGRLP